MANVNAPFGLRPIGASAASGLALLTFQVAADDTQAIFRGDPVALLDSGYITRWRGEADLIGVFWCCEYTDWSIGSRRYGIYWPGARDAARGDGGITAYVVALRADQQYLAQSGVIGADYSDIGRGAYVYFGEGSTMSGVSGSYIEPSDAPGCQFRIVGLNDNQGRPGPYSWVYVSPLFAAPEATFEAVPSGFAQGAATIPAPKRARKGPRVVVAKAPAYGSRELDLDGGAEIAAPRVAGRILDLPASSRARKRRR